MYQSSCGCENNGLGFVTEAIGVAASLFGDKGGSSGSGSGASSPVTVSPTISTQISPQISPVFQQQFQPQNSAATAGTAQSLPGMPTPSGMAPSSSPGFMPVGYGAPGVPAIPAQPVDWMKYAPYAIGAVALVAFLTMKKRKAA